MSTRFYLAAPLTLFALLAAEGINRSAPLAVLDDKPLLQVDPGGASAAITALAFSPDGKTLYAAGLDKVVRVWTWQGGGFVLKKTLRVPIGPGTGGAINALAVSPNGKWLAIAGRAPMRGEIGFQRTGVIVEAAAFPIEQLEDAGVIYLASTSDPMAGRVLRGHRGEVRALAFSPGRSDKPPILVSAATERDGDKRHGALRLWDVKTGKLLAERNDLPSRLEPPPGLAIWHTGPKSEDVRIAVAWPEDDDKQDVRLRVWNQSSDAAKAMEYWDADRYTRPLALLDRREILGGGLGPNEGRLLRWTAGNKEAPEIVAEFPRRDGIRFVPDAIGCVSEGADGALSHAVVILRPMADQDSALAIVDLAAKRVVAQVPLFKSDRIHLPVLAAVPGGRFVAVADAADHSIHMFAVADLLRGKERPAQILSGNGLTPRRVAFVDKGRGLWLSEDLQAKPLSGGLHFDFDTGIVERRKEKGDLVSDTPLLGEWSWTIDKDRQGVRVQQGKKDLPPVLLRDKETVTAVALRPATALEAALLAVAYTDRDNARTLIMLRRLDEAAPFRLLIGHLQDVRQLAFSASRPLLASVAEDQTVCVWALTDLDKSVGQVAGVGVADKEGKAVIHVVEKDSAASQAGLAVDDVLEAIGAPGAEPLAVTSAKDLLFAVSARRPGDRVAIKVKGKREPVALTVSRGMEGWKPLFSLFLLRASEGADWVGWSPSGPYDASSDAAERCVGWHTNTGDPACPVEFVHAGEHRKEYYRHGILGLLAAEADLGRALKKDDARHVPPEAALQPRRPENASFTKQDDVLLIRDAVPALRIGINADYPFTEAHVLRWTISRADGGRITDTEGALSDTARRDGTEWAADLSPVKWRRGEYYVHFSLSPGADAKTVAEKSLTLRFQPPAPTLHLSVDGKDVATTEQTPLKVMDDKLPIDILLGAAREQKVDLSFAQWVNGKEQNAPKPVQVEGGKLPQTLTLGKGVNRVALRAVNQGALAGHEEDETAVTALWVRFDVMNEPPPRFAVLKLDRVPDFKQIDKKEVWVVDRPRAGLDVRIEADGTLAQADWAAGDADPKSVLPVGKAAKTLEFHVDLDLKVGEIVPVRLRAKSKNSDMNTADVALVFYPPFPVVAMDTLKSPDFLAPKAALTGTFQAATPDPFDLVLRVTPEQKQAQEPKEFKAVVDSEKRTWKADLTVAPGRNQIEAFVRNKWRGEEAVDAVKPVLRYRRLPRIVEAKGVTAIETAVVDLPLEVQSPAGMPPRAITIEGQRFRSFKAVAGEEKDGLVAWKLVVPQVPVCDDGRKLEQLHLLAHNDDGPFENESLVKETVVNVIHKTIPKAADARFLLPKEVNERRSRCAIPYRVDSDSPLTSVEVRRGEEVLYRPDLKSVRKEGQRFVLEEKPELKLSVGLNNLTLVALNAGGRSGGSVVVNVPPPSVRVAIDHIELRTDKGDLEKSLKPISESADDAKFEEMPRSLVWLAGDVRWSDPEAKELDSRDLQVVVLVRGCRQFPVALEARGQGKDADARRFAVPVVLTDAENSVKIEVKENRLDGEKTVGQQVVSRSAFQLACAKPTTQQRLHLLIVGVNVKDGQALAKQVLDTLGAKDQPRGLQGEFKTDAFEKSILYRVLIGEVERGKVEAQLVEINQEIARLRKESKWLNDVILVYYQGEDVVKGGERWLKTSRNIQYPDVEPETYAIPCRALPREAGTQFLLLNVVGAPEGREQGTGLSRDAGVGLMRYAWSDARQPPKAESLLQNLGKALREKSLLGDVVGYLNVLLTQMPDPPDHHVVLDKDQAARKFGAPR